VHCCHGGCVWPAALARSSPHMAMGWEAAGRMDQHKSDANEASTSERESIYVHKLLDTFA
jgi:hypothetical protein